MLVIGVDCMFAHCAGSIWLAHVSIRTGAMSYQGAIANELGKLLVLSLVDARFQNAQRHGLLDDLIVIGDVALVDTAVKQSGRVMTTAQFLVSQSRFGAERFSLNRRLTLLHDSHRSP